MEETWVLTSKELVWMKMLWQDFPRNLSLEEPEVSGNEEQAVLQ